METSRLENEQATHEFGSKLASRLKGGDVVLLQGELGAGKTTLVRGLLAALGVSEGVRSPTFNIIQTFDTQPPVAHIDLYRVRTHVGLGIEDYLGSHLVLIEWPERAVGLVNPDECWNVNLVIDDGSRLVSVTQPKS